MQEVLTNLIDQQPKNIALKECSYGEKDSQRSWGCTVFAGGVESAMDF